MSYFYLHSIYIYDNFLFKLFSDITAIFFYGLLTKNNTKRRQYYTCVCFFCRFVHSLEVCLVQLVGYQRLMTEVETLRSTTYNSEDLIHEQKLLQLWSLLQPAIPLPTRKTKLWQNIGFQGTDPKTDFRGMGLLGLENLL